MERGVYKACPICKANSWKYGSDIHRSYKSKLANLVVRCDIHPECKDIKFPY